MIPIYDISQIYNENAYLHTNYIQVFENDVVEERYDSNLPKSILNLWENKNDDEIHTCNFLEQQDKNKRWIHLYSMFENSFEQKKELFKDIQSNIIFADFKQSLSEILTVYPEVISVGASNDECIYIYFEKNNKSVYFDLFFEPNSQTEVALTIFENKVSKLSFTDYLDNSINILKKEFITEDELSYSSLAEI